MVHISGNQIKFIAGCMFLNDIADFYYFCICTFYTPSALYLQCPYNLFIQNTDIFFIDKLDKPNPVIGKVELYPVITHPCRIYF